MHVYLHDKQILPSLSDVLDWGLFCTPALLWLVQPDGRQQIMTAWSICVCRACSALWCLCDGACERNLRPTVAHTQRICCRSAAGFRVLRTPATRSGSARGTTECDTHTRSNTETYTRHGNVVSESVCESLSGYAASWFYNSCQHGTVVNIPNNCTAGLCGTHAHM